MDQISTNAKIHQLVKTSAKIQTDLFDAVAHVRDISYPQMEGHAQVIKNVPK